MPRNIIHKGPRVDARLFYLPPGPSQENIYNVGPIAQFGMTRPLVPKRLVPVDHLLDSQVISVGVEGLVEDHLDTIAGGVVKWPLKLILWPHGVGVSGKDE